MLAKELLALFRVAAIILLSFSVLQLIEAGSKRPARADDSGHLDKHSSSGDSVQRHFMSSPHATKKSSRTKMGGGGKQRPFKRPASFLQRPERPKTRANGLGEYDNSTLDYSLSTHRMRTVVEKDSCNASWAYAGVATLEGVQSKLGFGQIVPLSAQMLIDCVGWECDLENFDIKRLFNYVAVNGIASQANYPRLDAFPYYQVCNNQRIQANIMKGQIKGSYFYDHKMVSNEFLIEKLRSFGPFIVQINHDHFQTRINAFVDERPCRNLGDIRHNVNTKTDRYVTLVGYGTKDGVDYFKYVSIVFNCEMPFLIVFVVDMTLQTSQLIKSNDMISHLTLTDSGTHICRRIR